MHATIAPVPVFPGTATRLYVRAGNLGPPPSFYWELQRVTVTPAPEPTEDNPEPQPTEAAEMLKNGNDTMTAEQWNAWDDSLPDEAYILQCVAQNLGLTLEQ